MFKQNRKEVGKGRILKTDESIKNTIYFSKGKSMCMCV
jgi:hypothetical protein